MKYTSTADSRESSLILWPVGLLLMTTVICSYAGYMLHKFGNVSGLIYMSLYEN